MNKAVSNIALCAGDGKPETTNPKSFPGSKPGAAMDKGDMGLGPSENLPCTNFRNGLEPKDEEKIKFIECETPGNRVLEDI